jgi:hypothetical protein
VWHVINEDGKNSFAFGGADPFGLVQPNRKEDLAIARPSRIVDGFKKQKLQRTQGQEKRLAHLVR